MKKVELLSPAGNMESLISAVQNGADAVYVGGKKFGARAYASNFDYNEMIEAIKYCHLYGVKIYVTVNTICFEDEIEDVLSYIEFLYTNNVDALIMQDFGLISIVRKKFPNMEIHASTQMHNHNDSGLALLKNLGVKRAVLDRELSLDEIKKLKTDIEKEIFVHGALCVSYSGCCLFSAMHGKRSGNRGECVGVCRLPYKLLENNEEIQTNGDYLLSTRSLCTIKHIDKLIESGVSSFKIEGRMKSKEYVGYITRIYRKKIDEYYLNKKYHVTEEEINNFKKLYNRNFTEGFLFNDNIINIKSSNHIGVLLGNVIKIDKNKIIIKLLDDLNQGDGIRFDNYKGMIINKLYNENGLLTNRVLKGSIAILDNKIDLINAKTVRKTLDINLINEINKNEERKVNVSLFLKAKIKEKLELSINDSENIITTYGSIIEKAKTSPITEERIKTQIEKLGDTVFYSTNTSIDMDDNIFISIKELNNLRREVCEKLKEKREYRSNYYKIINHVKEEKVKNTSKKLILSILTRNEEQLKVAIDNKIDYIYTDDYSLYKKYKFNNVYLRLDRVTKNNIDYENENILITELGGVYNYSKNNIVNSDYTLNVVNHLSIDTLKQYGIKRICLSPETKENTLNNLSNYDNIDLLVYGRVELMIMKYCPIKTIINDNKENCTLCFKNKYELEDIDNNIYPLIHKNHITHILDCNNIDLIDNLDKYIEYGINSFRIDLYDEKKDKIEKIINSIKDKYYD